MTGTGVVVPELPISTAALAPWLQVSAVPPSMAGRPVSVKATVKAAVPLPLRAMVPLALALLVLSAGVPVLSAMPLAKPSSDTLAAAPAMVGLVSLSTMVAVALFAAELTVAPVAAVMVATTVSSSSSRMSGVGSAVKVTLVWPAGMVTVRVLVRPVTT